MKTFLEITDNTGTLKLLVQIVNVAYYKKHHLVQRYHNAWCSLVTFRIGSQRFLSKNSTRLATHASCRLRHSVLPLCLYKLQNVHSTDYLGVLRRFLPALSQGDHWAQTRVAFFLSSSYRCFKGSPPWRAVEEAEIKQHEGAWTQESGEGHFTVGFGVPFRLLMTACPCEECVFLDLLE